MDNVDVDVDVDILSGWNLDTGDWEIEIRQYYNTYNGQTNTN